MSNPVINELGDKFWYNEKRQHHREDGPACEYSNGDKEYYINGKLHRRDGPAAILSNGAKYWYQNGHRHRLDGPALEQTNGYKEYWINGKEYSSLSLGLMNEALE